MSYTSSCSSDIAGSFFASALSATFRLLWPVAKHSCWSVELHPTCWVLWEVSLLCFDGDFLTTLFPCVFGEELSSVSFSSSLIAKSSAKSSSLSPSSFSVCSSVTSFSVSTVFVVNSSAVMNSTLISSTSVGVLTFFPILLESTLYVLGFSCLSCSLSPQSVTIPPVLMLWGLSTGPILSVRTLRSEINKYF